MKESISLAFKPLKLMKGSKIVYFLFMIIGGMNFPLVQMLLSLAQKNLVNAIEFNQPNYMNLVYIFSVLILLFVMFVDPVATFYRKKSVRSFIKNLRKYIVKKSLDLPMSFFEHTHSADIMTKINNDLEAVSSMYTWSLYRFLLAVFYGAGSISIMMFLCWQLAILIIVLACVEVWIMAKASIKIRENSKFIQEKITFKYC
jgi:ABC-type multidrug transport system fused ATPase/permease subunit